MIPLIKTALFVDGSNLYATTKALGFDMDYGRLLNNFKRQAMVLRAFYFTAVLPEHEVSPLRPLVDWLDYNGWSVITKETKEFTDSASGRRKIKGNMDIEIAIHMLKMAKHVDKVILFSGDGDFRALVEAVQAEGVHVTVVSTIKTQPRMIADELRRQADEFVELEDIRQNIQRSYEAEQIG